MIGALVVGIGAAAWAATQIGRGNGGTPAAARADSASTPSVSLAAQAKVDSSAGAIDTTKRLDSSAVRAPVVSGVLTVEIARPKPIHVGDSVTLRGTAKWPDGTGTPVRWSSSADSVARIDERTGLVTGTGAGTATITAQAGAASKQVSLTVLPAPGGATPAGSAASGGYSASAYGATTPATTDVTQALSARVQEFVQAVADRDIARVTALYGAESADDKKNLASLVDKLRNPSTKLKLSAPQVGMPVIRETEATIDFIARVAWTTPTGGTREPSVAFRVYFGHATDGWRLAGVRMLNALE
jgi:hypothetical protein